MIIVFNCPHCAAILRMKEQYGGQRGRCPQCQGEITVPAIETDAGMDLMPLDPSASPAGGAGPAATSEPPPASSPPLFSIESRIRAMTGAMATDAAAGAAPPSQTGDSNIGLAPVDDSPHSARPRPAAPSALDPPPRADKSGGPSDSTIGLAPVDDEPKHATRPPPPPPAPAQPASSEGEDENFGLAPLEESAHKASSAKPASATANGSAASAGATTDSKADVRITVVCDGCGARMRVPPTAAGRQLSCPRCKKKVRVPEAKEPTPSGTAGDTRRSSETPSSSSGNLDMGMLDELEGVGPAAEDAPPAALAGAVAKGKGKSKGKGALLGQSKQSTVLGMPPLVVYGGGALGLVALIGGLAIVYVVTKPATPPPAPTIVAQTPAPGTPAPGPTPATGQPGGPPTPAPGGPPAPTQTTPANPNGGPVATDPNAADPNGTDPNAALPGGPGVTPTPDVTPTPTPTATPAAERVEWRDRIPVVRLTSGKFKSESDPTVGEGQVAIELLTVPRESPRVEPKPEEIKVLVKVAPTILKTQQPLLARLKQMTNLNTVKQNAPQWAELTAQGLDQIRQVRRLAGVGLPTEDKQKEYQAMLDEEVVVVAAQAELDRLAQMPGAIDALVAALKERAAREPNSALAATLQQAESQ